MKKLLLLALLFYFKIVIAQNGDFNNNSTLNCTGNTFWANTWLGPGTPKVYEFELNNNTIISNGVVAFNCPEYGLAVCNNLNGGGFTPTFYSSTNTLQQNTPCFFDSLLWVDCGLNDSMVLYNCGGINNIVYFSGRMPNDPSFKYILKYDGANLSLIYQTPQFHSIAVADIAADANNNAWFFTFIDSLGPFAKNLNVIDNSGTLLQQYNSNFDFVYGYGLCIIGDSLYVGFGNNFIYQNSLVSVLLSGNTATLYNQISFPALSYIQYLGDLASCNPGIPTGFKEIKNPTEAIITLYPNPATDKITVGNLPANAKQLCITNSMGAVVWRQDLSPTPALPGGEGVKNERQLVVNTSRFAPGMYAVCVKTNKEVLVKKMVKL